MKVNFAYLDSGTGGLPYLKYLKNKMPDASCVYVGDTKNFPYGEKSKSEIIEKSSECVKKIIEKCFPDVIVVACNTISVSALDELRRRFPEIPFVGTVPAVKPAAKITKTKRIGLLATNATVNHPYTKRLISDFAGDCEVFSLGAPELINFIEHKYYFADYKERVNAAKPCCDYFKQNGCDVIVLACTHFLNMAEEIKDAAGAEIKVVDSREGVTRHALEIFAEVKKNDSENTGSAETVELSKSAANFEKSGKSSSALYITGFTEKNDEKRYLAFCEQNNIKFGGLL